MLSLAYHWFADDTDLCELQSVWISDSVSVVVTIVSISLNPLTNPILVYS
jgi:hypothetical protein